MNEGRIFYLCFALIFSFLLPAMIANVFGWEEAFSSGRIWLLTQPAWIKWPAYALYGGCGFIAVTIIMAIVMEVGSFLLDTAKTGAQWVVEKAEDLADLVSYIIKGLLCVLFGLLIAAPLGLCHQFVKLFPLIFNYVLELFKLLELYWKTDQQEFKSFWAFRRYMRGEDNPEPKQDKNRQNRQQAPPKQDKPRNTYQIALELLDLPADNSFTQSDLKKRYRTIISRVHPDKGCPTPVLAQQINDAVKIIKQRRNWT